jgi:hypothetical protein
MTTNESKRKFGAEMVQSDSSPLSEPTKGFFSNLDELRESFGEDISGIGSKEVLIRVPVRRPKKSEFIRTHPDSNMQLAATVYSDRDENEDVYFVTKEMRDKFDEGQLKAVRLQLTISRRGVLFIWPLTLPLDGKSMGRSWHESALKAAEMAKDRWIRIVADKGLSGYRVHLAEGQIADPTWPQYSFGELLEIAFEGRIIRSADHPVIRDLRGLK